MLRSEEKLEGVGLGAGVLCATALGICLGTSITGEINPTLTAWCGASGVAMATVFTFTPKIADIFFQEYKAPKIIRKISSPNVANKITKVLSIEQKRVR